MDCLQAERSRKPIPQTNIIEPTYRDAKSTNLHLSSKENFSHFGVPGQFLDSFGLNPLHPACQRPSNLIHEAPTSTWISQISQGGYGSQLGKMEIDGYGYRPKVMVHGDCQIFQSAAEIPQHPVI